MIGTANTADIIAIAVPVGLAGLALAWRLGGLERSVRDVQSDVHEMKGQVRDLSNKANGVQNDVHEMKGQVRDLSNKVNGNGD